MKVLVAYSGGKDSQACLLWAVKEYGVQNIEAVFCDTGWENPITYEHIKKTTADLGVKLVTVKSKTYDGMIDMAEKKGRFPSVKARFCTAELKSIPFIDYVLDHKEHLIVIQGIRAMESQSRSQMQKQCTYFKYYFEPYNIDPKTGKVKEGQKPKYHTYRKKEVKAWCKIYSDDILRPVFYWTGQQVIDYIIENGQQPNILYKQGFKRVGCFPCIMSGHKEVYEIIKRYPERFDEIIEHEKRIGSSFFKIDFVPDFAQKGACDRTGKKFTTGEDVRNYLESKNQTIDMFADDSPISCSSYYHLCE
jgi:3'-phosphoadenosine 5'-phosphosulfate sulfotransferase (PAPS reductase)/FAD synthetase